MKTKNLLFFILFLSSCNYSKPLDQPELLVPPFIQAENPELYQIFKEEKAEKEQ